MENQARYWELFIKEKSGQINPDELLELESWKRQNQALAQEYEHIYESTEDSTSAAKFNPHEDWKDLQTMIKVESDRGGAMRRLVPWMLRVAAALLLVLGFSFIYFQYTQFGSDDLNLQELVQTQDEGNRLVELEDGSKVWLNRNSELLYPASFADDSRTLFLKGEAFFEVTPDKDRPFIVYSGNSKTTVLGTSFNLRAYSKEDEVKLTVVTGKVAFTLTDDKEGVTALPGDVASLDAKSKTIEKLSNKDQNFLSWKTGQLMFDDSPITQLIIALERHFDVEIESESASVLDCRFTGDFNQTKLEDALKVIARATGTTYTYEGGQYVISGNGCK